MQLRVRNGKGVKGRVLPLSERLLQELENYWRAQRQGKAAHDSPWVGNVDAETFGDLVSDLLLLLAEPDRQGVLTMADHLGGEDWWNKHRLGYGVVTTVAQFATLGQSVEDGRFHDQVPAG